MIAALIRWSVANRVLVVIAALIVAALGAWSVKQTPVDALPDLSDVQVLSLIHISEPTRHTSQSRMPSSA